MKGFTAFLRKELLEQVRTHRLLVVLTAFVLVGLISPLLAKITPELVGMVAEDELGGMELIMTREPGVNDALLQYHSNFSLLPLLVILLSFGAVSGEKSRKTAPMVLVKPVSRRSFLMAKAAAPAALITAGTVLAAAGCLLYTTVLFGEVDLAGYLLVNAMLLLALVTFLTWTLLASVLARSQGAAAGIALGGFILFSILGALPLVGKYTPAGLMSTAGGIILGRDVSAVGWSMAATALLAFAFLVAADRILSRQEL
ncbi:MAG: ABC transporter permease [Myxococcota bacterium]